MCQKVYFRFDANRQVADSTGHILHTMHAPAGYEHITGLQLKLHVLRCLSRLPEEKCYRFLGKIWVKKLGQDGTVLKDVSNHDWVEDMEVLIHVDHPLTRHNDDEDQKNVPLVFASSAK